MGRNPVSPAERAEAIRLKAEGLSLDEIARRLNRPRGSINTIVYGQARSEVLACGRNATGEAGVYFDKDYSDEELDLLRAAQRSGLVGKQPDWARVLTVVKALGYRKVAEPQALPRYTHERSLPRGRRRGGAEGAKE